MRHKGIGLTLALGAVWTLTCPASVAQRPEPAAAVYLGRSSALGFRGEGGTISWRLLREMLRQSFLVAARDELGLPTRDVSLGEEMPSGGGDAPFEVCSAGGPENLLEVRRGFARPGQTLLRHDLGIAAVRLADARGPAAIFAVDYRAVLIEAEKLSRGGYVDALRKAGFQGTPPARKDSAEVPAAIEQALEKMDFVSQFSAIRQLHALVRADGQSPERLGALVRGYANLGLLTEFHWHPAYKTFKARSLVYAQRLAATGKPPVLGAWHRAYAFALAGLHKLALDDLQSAAELWKAAGGAPGRPAWVDLLDAYCRFDHARLKAAASGGGKDLATLLWFDSLEYSDHSPPAIEAALEAIQRMPECYTAYDCLCDHGGVSVGHRATTQPLIVAGRTIYPRVAAVPGLPQTVAEIAQAAGEPSDDRDAAFQEFATRGKLIRALLDSDGTVAEPAEKSAAKSSPPEKPPAGPRPGDCGEPSWVCLGRLISNLSFIHAWRRAHFERSCLGVPAEEFIKAAAPLVEAHPYRYFLGTCAATEAARKEAWNKLTIPEMEDLEYAEASMWREYRSRRGPAAGDIQATVDGLLDAEPRDLHFSWQPQPFRVAALLLAASPHSPEGRAVAIGRCGDEYQPRFAEWEGAAERQPAVAMAFARRARAAARWSEAEKWLKILADGGDRNALESLADIYQQQGKMDLWVAALEATLNAPDYALSHATAQTRIARYYMHGKQWEKALPYGKAAAECYSEWGLRVCAECLEATRDWKAAEELYKAIGKRYPGNGEVEWYLFCRRTGQGDRVAALRTRAEYARKEVGMTEYLTAYLVLENKMGGLQQVLRLLCGYGDPIYHLHLAVVVDQMHDAKERDQALAGVQSKAKAYKQNSGGESYAPLGALAGLIADDLAKGGKGEIDLAAAERLSPPQSFHDGQACELAPRPGIAFYYFLGHYLDLHGKPQPALRCWKRCLGETQVIADGYRTLAAAELLAHGVKPETCQAIVEKGPEGAEKAEAEPLPISAAGDRSSAGKTARERPPAR
jgi:hypothetical protein